VSSERSEPEVASDPQRLNGWKEIAAHLGKGVRTVQRWERDYGLPIRRIGRPGGEIVFAFKQEIDRWSAESGSKVVSASELDAQTVDKEPAPQPAPSPARRRIPRSVVIAAAAGSMAAGLVAAYIWLMPTPRPVRAVVEGQSLIALDREGRRLWTYPVDFEPNINTYSRQYEPQYGMNKLLVSDLDADGVNEVILATSSVGGRGPQGFRVLNAAGDMRFRIEPDEQVTFGNEAFAGPWTVYRMFVTNNPDGSRSIWTAFIHNLWFPTLVLETDSRGTIKSRYWSNGYIEQIEVTDVGGRPSVLIGGTHNDTRGASLAVFDYGAVKGSAPAIQDRYKCRNCDPGGPKEFLVFPRTCIAEAMVGQATAVSVSADDIGRLFLLAAEGPRHANGEFYAGNWYTIEPGLSGGSTRLAVGTPVAHRELETSGRIDHAYEDPRHGSPQARFLRWDGSTLTTIEIPAIPIPAVRSTAMQLNPLPTTRQIASPPR
jgi:hypothetical protein